MGEQQVRSSSPPLPGKGYYSMDFDAPGENLSTFQTKKEIEYSPPLIRKDQDNSSDSLKPNTESVPGKNDSVIQDDNRSVSEMETTPKRRKPKDRSSSSSTASKQSSIPVQSKNSQGADVPVTIPQEEGDGKPDRPKKSGLKKPRSSKPLMSMSYDEQVHRELQKEPVRSSSPPLASKGFYNIDSIPLDDGLEASQTKKEVNRSPPLTGKDQDTSSSLTSKTESAPAKDDALQDNQPSSVAELETTPKRRKSRSSSSSSRQSLIPLQRSSSQDSQRGDVPGVPQDEGGESEKPVRHRKSGTKKSRSARPMSMSYDEQCTPERRHLFDNPATTQSADSSETLRHPNSTSSSIPQDSTPAKNEPHPRAEKGFSPPEKDLPFSPPKNVPPPSPKKLPERPDSSSTHPEKDPLQLQKKVPPPAPPAEQPDAATGPEPSNQPPEQSAAPPLPENVQPPVDKSPLPRKKHRTRSASVASEDGSEVRVKKEKSAGKVKKSKSKKSGSSGSSRRGDESAEAGVDGGEAAEKGRERKSSRRRSSQGEGAGMESSVSQVQSSAPPVQSSAPQDQSSVPLVQPIVPTADAGGVKSSSPPAVKVLEQNKSSPESGGESGMTSSHSRDSIIKLVQVLKYSQSDWNKLRQELEIQLQAQLRANDGDWSAKLAEREAHSAGLEEQIRKLKQTNEDMRVVMGEFEKTIGQLQSDKEKMKNASEQSLKDVLREKDQAVEDLRSVETAFSDLHRRYEKTKAVLEGFKQNEDVLKKCVQDLQNKVKKAEQKTQIVRAQAEDRLDRATEDLEKTKKVSASDMAKLEAALRKAHVQVDSLEAALEQKVKENKELTAICDELIAKVQ